MKNTSNFELNREWIKSNILLNMNHSSLEENNNYLKHVVENEVDNSKLYTVLLNTGLKYKHIIKKIPLLYKLSMKVRYKLAKHTGNKRNESIALYNQLEQYTGVEFVSFLYRYLLNREPDNEGLRHYLILLNEGVSKRLIFDLFVKSKEFSLNNNETKYFPIVGRKTFVFYQIKRFIKKTPFIWIYRFFYLPQKVNQLHREFGLYTMFNDLENSNLKKKYKELSNEYIETSLELQSIKGKNFEYDKMFEDIKINLNKLKMDIHNTNKVQQYFSADLNGIKTEMQNLREKMIKRDEIVVIKLEEIEKIINQGQKKSDKLEIAFSTQNEIMQGLSTQAKENSVQLNAISTAIDLIEKNSKPIPSPITSSKNVTVIKVDDFMVGVPAEEWRLAAYMYFKGHLEPGLVKTFSSLVNRGMTVIDIGANVGIYTLLAARNLQGNGKIYSFEPAPRTFTILRNNIQLNGYLELDLIHLYNIALSDNRGISQFAIYSDNNGHNSLYPKPETKAEDIINVPTDTLDAIVGNERVDIIKLDAEGAEPFILRGMANIILNNPDLKIFMELAPEHIERSGTNLLDFINDLEQSYKFVIKKIEDSTGEILAVSREELLNCTSLNLYLSRKDCEMDS